ncbi:hypothetical protein BOX15_Mlig028928g2 [Macrostomum lignano]|uniref:Uncharacterized protein n=1 Tax=Macrostomum lignano TaxID=282301 RepID=A0A267DDZ7_9PLAT|nr:hypothetical protein BOX15_Mlig028928g2 [Macrostomum lignano]
MAYERKKDGTKLDANYEYILVHEEEECDSDSSDTFFNGPKSKKGQSGFKEFSPRVQVALCIILILAVILFVFVIYNFLYFIISLQNAMHKLQEKIPLICKTAHALNSKLAHGLKFCPNSTATLPANITA